MFEKLLQTLLQSFQIFHKLKGISLNPASFLYNLASAFVSSVMEIIGATDVALDRLDVQNAVLEDLDALAFNYDLIRNFGTPSTGIVFLWTYEPENDIVIPTGTSLNAEDGTEFTTTVDCIIPVDPTDYPSFSSDAYPDSDNNLFNRFYAVPLKAGVTYDETRPFVDQVEDTLNISATSSEIGRTQNIDREELVDIALALGGTNPVTLEEEVGISNERPFGGGSDEEDDDVFRARILEHISGTSTTTVKAIEASALIPGIDDARVLEQSDVRAGFIPPLGFVYVMVASARARYTPEWAALEPEVKYTVPFSSNTKEEVRNILEDERSIGVGIIVKEASIISINFSTLENSSADEPMTIYVEPGTNLLSANSQIEELFRSFLESFKIGTNVYKSDIVEKIRELTFVVDISPFEIKATRWVVGTDGVVSKEILSLGSQEGLEENREGIIVKTEEIARPPKGPVNFILKHDTQIR